MSTTASAPARSSERPRPSWRTVGLPVEHGGWSLLFEPLILGLLVAPSPAGAWLALSTIAAFLARHPLKLAATDRRRGVRYPRTGLAESFFLAYAAIGAVAFAVALAGSGPFILAPLALAAPAALFALRRDLQGRSRETLPEILGAVALGSSATLIILAAGGPVAIAWIAWGLGSLRVVTTILYVRARVRVDRDAGPGLRRALARPVLAAHAGAVFLALAAVVAGWLSPIAASAFLLLLLRAAHGLAASRPSIRPQMLGVQEVLVGLGCLALFIAGLLTMSG